MFRAFWRWHFYASFVVVPILLMLAVTGATYLLRFQIEPVLHADVMTADPGAGQNLRQPYEAQRLAVERAYPDRTLISMTEPRSEGHSTVFSTETPEGSPRDVFVDPWSGQVLGELNPDTTVSGAAVLLHAELMAGRWGDYLIELGASWMTITGYYLFLRGRAAGCAPEACGLAGRFCGTGMP